MRVRIVDTGENLVGALDVEIAALLDLVGAFSGDAGLAVNDKQAAAPFVTARQTMLCCVRRLDGKRNSQSSRDGSRGQQPIRKATGHHWIPPSAHVERPSAG
ncbi:hypothetical protein P9272_31450 [Mesorhizobium sp. WSM4976]|uniref:hypothetical protein n=1 Tax=Mesorhizobium sp. WSM4976 TaxID=3038549 RepID=UPI0024174002|nr:hypothetical protein [Mesorhizobium sp. WSM4976]MDG4898060.1 hypothetical protein [Mesorhizobium sp. WSM4976]